MGLKPHQLKHYTISKPLETHFRQATCVEVACKWHAKGWVTSVDESTALGQQQAHYIRSNRKGQYVEKVENGLTAFRFKPGNTCFAADKHLVSLDREPLYTVGDRGRRTRHKNGLEWVEDFATHQQKLKQATT